MVGAFSSVVAIVQLEHVEGLPLFEWLAKADPKKIAPTVTAKDAGMKNFTLINGRLYVNLSNLNAIFCVLLCKLFHASTSLN